MTSSAEGLQAAAQVLKEDIRKIDAGEVAASPAHRAFLAGAVKGLKGPEATESGGYPVDPNERTVPQVPDSAQHKALDADRPENSGIAEQQN